MRGKLPRKIKIYSSWVLQVVVRQVPLPHSRVSILFTFINSRLYSRFQLLVWFYCVTIDIDITRITSSSCDFKYLLRITFKTTLINKKIMKIWRSKLFIRSETLASYIIHLFKTISETNYDCIYFFAVSVIHII